MNINFIQFEKILEKVDIEFSASFVHGVLTAFCCKKNKADKSWIKLITQTIDSLNVSQQENLKKLDTIKNDTEELLKSSDLKFNLLINSESEQTIEEESLLTRDWASGFFLGLKSLNLDILDEPSKEFIKDLKHIVAMPIATDSNKDTQEDLFQIQEYLKIGVLNLYLSI